MTPKPQYKKPPLTSENELDRTVAKRNALNKQRSKAMERRIAGTLRGRRIPMSGAAAQYKGDVEIPFYNYPGKYIIECKLSAQRNSSTNEPEMRLNFEWFPKIQDEAKSMAAKFGILIIHFHGFNNDYVFLKRSVVELLMQRYRSNFSDDLMYMLGLTPLIDLRYNKDGSSRSGYKVRRYELEDNMTEVKGLKGMRLLLPDSEYLVVHLDTYKAITEHL